MPISGTFASANTVKQDGPVSLSAHIPKGLIPRAKYPSMIREGIIGKGSMKVTDKDTAMSLGSGTLPVLATPAMILLIERAVSECLVPFLKEGESTVGTSLDIRHSAPSVVGSEVFCSAEIIETNGPKIVFEIRVWDSAGEVGSGRHERFLVDDIRFMSRAASRTKG